MPYSSFVFDESLYKIIKFLQPTTFLDLGAGAGKYGSIVKKINPAIKTIAIEIEKSYIGKFRLNDLYNDVWNISVNDLIKPAYYDLTYDVVMIDDAIEHLKKSDGINLLNFLIYRTRWIILQFPYRFLQNSVGGYHSEAHISVWGESDFQTFERTRLYKKETQRLIVLKGFLEEHIAIEDVALLMSEYEK